jgi:hypothetical protein
MTELLYYSEKIGCGATLRLDSGEPCLISVSQKGVFLKKSRFGFFGAMLYYESNVYKAAIVGRNLDFLFPEKIIPHVIKNPVLIAFVNAAWHCHTAAKVCITVNEAAKNAERVKEIENDLTERKP